MTTYPKFCLWCEKAFDAPQVRGKYCSQACYSKDRRMAFKRATSRQNAINDTITYTHDAIRILKRDAALGLFKRDPVKENENETYL